MRTIKISILILLMSLSLGCNSTFGKAYSEHRKERRDRMTWMIDEFEQKLLPQYTGDDRVKALQGLEDARWLMGVGGLVPTN